jgi:protein disulfide-isomerase A6
MKGSILFLLVSLLYLSANAAVTDFGPENFDTIVGKIPAFVEFFAPWCGHCQRLAPEYEVVGDAFGKYASRVAVAKIDCDASENKPICNANDITGFPTLKWFSADGTPESYQGGRTADDIISFINSKTGLKAGVTKAPSKVFDLTTANFDSLVINSDKFVLVEFFAPWCGHCKNLAPIYEELANAFSREPSVLIAKVDATQEPDLASRYGVEGYPTLKWFSADDKQNPENYIDQRQLDSLVNYVNVKAKLQRNEYGRLNEKAGRIAELDEIASQFLESDSKEALLEQTQEIVNKLEKSKAASFYPRVMQKVLKDGDGYVQKEVDRLMRMIETNAVKADKVDEFTVRVNVLSSFLSVPPSE